MGNLTQREVLDLVGEFESRVLPNVSPTRVRRAVEEYIHEVRQRLHTAKGTPVRNIQTLSRVFKYYVQTPVSKYAAQDIPCALHLASLSGDATAAVKKARLRDFYQLFPNKTGSAEVVESA